jgi:Lon-like ATP-dependent protease
MLQLFLTKGGEASLKRFLSVQKCPFLYLKAPMLAIRPAIRSFSDSKGDSVDKFIAAEERADATEDTDFEPNDSTALISAKVPDNTPVLLSVQVGRRPVFPGFYKTIAIHDQNVVRALSGLLKRRMPYLGIFMRSSDNDQVDLVRNLSEVHKTGVMAQLITLTGPSLDSALAVVLPHRRIRALDMVGGSEEFAAKLRVENISDEPYDKQDSVIRAVCQEIYVTLAEMVKISPFFREHLGQRNMPSAVFEDPARLADFVAVLCAGQPQELQDILETRNIAERLQKALVLLKKEQIHAQLQNKIREDVETKVNQRQREYFLHEQLKSIKKELGIETDTKEKLTQLFNERAAGLKMPEAVKRVFDEELGKLSTLEPAGAEFNVTRNYLDWLTQLPWGKVTEDSYNLEQAREVLEHDHFGMDDVKKRILEFIAVAQLKGSPSGKIICFVGPPGVGKTSIGKSIARALHREFFRFSVGGLTDVAEIKGHRRTYVGSMPGKLIQALKKVQSENPVIMIDESKKMPFGLLLVLKNCSRQTRSWSHWRPSLCATRTFRFGAEQLVP